MTAPAAPTAQTATIETTSTPTPSSARVVSVLGLIIGVLTLVETYFGTGHLPTAAQVAGVLAGSGVTLGSVVAFVAHHLGELRLHRTTTATPLPELRPQSPTAPPAAPTT